MRRKNVQTHFSTSYVFFFWSLLLVTIDTTDNRAFSKQFACKYVIQRFDYETIKMAIAHRHVKQRRKSHFCFVSFLCVNLDVSFVRQWPTITFQQTATHTHTRENTTTFVFITSNCQKRKPDRSLRIVKFPVNLSQRSENVLTCCRNEKEPSKNQNTHLRKSNVRFILGA